MSYCAVENTTADMAVELGTTEDFSNAKDWFEDRNPYEQRNVKRLRRLCEEFLEFTEDLQA